MSQRAQTGPPPPLLPAGCASFDYRSTRFLLLLLSLFCLAPPRLLAAEQPTPAELKVSGYGILGNRKLKKVVELMEEPGKKPELFDANFVEDAVLILMSRIQRDGFLKPEIRADLTLADGRHASYGWQHAVREQALPRPLQIRRVVFNIKKGVHYYFGHIQFAGLTIIPEKTALSYFVETGGLLPLKQTRIYSPDRLQRGLTSLTEVLNRQGYESADARAAELHQDDRSGRVDVLIQVTEGRQSFVRSIREEYFYTATNLPDRVLTLQTNVPFSKLWLQDFMQKLRGTNYHQGYPDTTVDITQPQRITTNNIIQVHLLAQIRSGPKIQLGQVKFVGEKKTKPSVMASTVRLEPGSVLDRILVDEGRSRLARLGVFDTVGLTYESVDEHTRNAVYQVKEGKSIDLSLLFGYGSYELLRGGIELDQNNIFGRAHHARLLLTQSFKASYGEYVYTIPEFLARDMDFFLNGSALRREEISFTREEFGGGFGVREFVQPIQSDVTVRYNYQVLNATAAELFFQEGLPSANVGAVITEVKHDRQDNPLYPRKGYKIFGTVEIASEYLGGDVNYQRLELSTAYHHSLGTGRWLHLGMSHGAVLTVGSTAQDLPFNRRFFPGGQNSIRGYQEGEAAPRNAQGQIVGAESYLFGSVELEQSLTASWSLVGFFDTVSFAEHLRDYPFNESLFSVGGGIRWKTIIGPVRLEYGYNLNPRPHDPTGTLQLSIGFPF